jgi:hypothetical protein
MKRRDRKKLKAQLTEKEEEKSTGHKREKVVYDDSTSEGEIRSDDDNEEKEQYVEQEEILDLTTKYPPCIRAILLSYNVNEEHDNSNDEINEESEFNQPQQLGSLFLIPYTGGSIGSSKNNLIHFPKSSEVGDLHVVISYDLQKRAYFIQGLYLCFHCEQL